MKNWSESRERVFCVLCGSERSRRLYIKRSRSREPFAIVRCHECGLEFVNRRPTALALRKYYSLDYFARRDDRGYNDYMSSTQEKEVLRVLAMNLADLGFFAWEQKIRGLEFQLHSLDIGAASGLVVSYFQNRGWRAQGVEIAEDLARKGIERYQVDLRIGNFLELDLPESSFHLITLWATIEHLPDPDQFIKKAGFLLRPGGRLILSTCRAGNWNFRKLFGRKWRFYNVPEHLYYFSRGQLDRLVAQNSGMRPITGLTYGSGVRGLWKRAADWLAKRARLGDMMAVIYEKQDQQVLREK